MEKDIEKRTIKVVWIEKPDELNSKMFDSEKDAEEFAKTREKFLIFKLAKRGEDEFTWQLLPYGMHKKYKMGMELLLGDKGAMGKLLGF